MSDPNLAEAFRLLQTDPAQSERLIRAALAEADDPGVRLMLAGARRLQGDHAGALQLSAAVAAEHANWAGAQFERGMALAGLGRHAEALAAFQMTEKLGALPGLWRETGDVLWAMGERARAEQAYAIHLRQPTPEPLVHEALTAMQTGDNARAETALRQQLQRYPNDVFALRVLAEILSSAGRFEEAAPLLRTCLDRTPSFALARYGLAMVLFHDHQLAPALEQADLLLAGDPRRLEYLNLKADAQGRLGDYEASAKTLETIIALYPADANAHANLGHILRALGRRAECEAAYKRAIAINPALGSAYWGFANLKTYRFDAADIAAMRANIPQAQGEEKTAMLFALGKALEDEGKFEDAFTTYSTANASHRATLPHDRQEREDAAMRARAVFTPQLFADRKGQGAPARDPIFIVGMPRSGSTLVEQILASHSAVEGTQELIELLSIAKRLENEGVYPEMLRTMPAEQLRALGEEYLERARPFRKTDAPRFIDKMPNNFTQTGLIQLILPNATIVDVRRNPLACCVSIFKQHWATGQSFAYDLGDIGAFYRSYVELMAHFDAVLPGRVHRVIYEELVANPEAETRHLLDACGLPFEEACLKFYENKRAVRTPSSEQVRQPIYASGVDSWKPFEHWLKPLKDALGPVLDAYPAAPPL